MPILALLGLGSSAAGAIAHQARPWLLPVTGAMLALSFYYAYVRRPSRRNKLLAWGATAFSAAALIAGALLS